MPPRGAARRPSAASASASSARGFRAQSGGGGSARSSPLSDLRRRVLSDAAALAGPGGRPGGGPGGRPGGGLGGLGALAGPGGGGGALGEHRRRAWEMAFGPSDGAIEVATMELSLVCPYSRVAMRRPVRCTDCRHLQCCDLDSWIALLEKHKSMRDPSAPCPVCEQRVAASRLEVDLWQLHAITQMPPGTHMLVLDADGSYRSGDASRDQRRAEVTEVLDATQTSPGVCDAGDAESGPHTPPLVGVKRERSSEEMPMPPPLSFSEPAASACPTQDDDVVIVAQYDNGAKSQGRVLPSLARLWIAHCPCCRRALLKNESGNIEGCADCGVSGAGVSDGLTLVRSFSDSPVSLELTADGTLLLCGVDAMAAYLLRAGFSRPMYADKTGIGLWYTTAELSRYELDFLEACCLRLSRGESLEDIPAVPALFRISWRRAARDGLTQTSNVSSFFRVHVPIA